MNKLQITEMLKLHHPEISGRQSELYIEMAANKIAEETNITKKTFTKNSVAGTRWYDLDASVMKIDKVFFNDVKIPKLIGEPIIDDDEIDNPEDISDTALSNPTSNAVTRDGRTSNYQSCSVTGTSNIRIYCTTFATTFTETATGVDPDDATLSTVGPLRDIPTQFHEILLTGAIAMAYKYPPNIDFNMYSAFNLDFERGIKRIKKFERTKEFTGFIRPQEF